MAFAKNPDISPKYNELFVNDIYNHFWIWIRQLVQLINRQRQRIIRQMEERRRFVAPIDL